MRGQARPPILARLPTGDATMASERMPRWKRRAYNIEALRAEARRVLPRAVFDFVDGGAGDEHTLRRNMSAFDDVALYPRPIGGTASRDLSTTLFGRRISMPLIVPPTGLAGLLWPDGEAASARAATKAGSIYCLSHGSVCTLEELAETGVAPRWFQTYIYTDRGLTHEMAARAAAAGYEALVVTIDTQMLGNRERDIRNGFVIPPRFSAGEIANMATRTALAAADAAHHSEHHLRQLPPARRRQRPHHPPPPNADAARPGHAVGRRRGAAGRLEGAAAAQGRASPRRCRRGGGERRGRDGSSPITAAVSSTALRARSTRCRAWRRPWRAAPRCCSTAGSGGAPTWSRRWRSARTAAPSAGRSSGGWRSRARPASPTPSTSSAASSTSPWASADSPTSPRSARTCWRGPPPPAAWHRCRPRCRRQRPCSKERRRRRRPGGCRAGARTDRRDGRPGGAGADALRRLGAQGPRHRLLNFVAHGSPACSRRLREGAA